MTRNAVGRLAMLFLLACVVASAVAAPANAARQWSWSRPQLIDHRAPPGTPYSLDSLACPSTRLCVAGADFGTVEWSRRPTAGASSWRAATVDHALGSSAGSTPATVTAVSCGSPSFCVAVDASGNALASRHPTDGVAAWKRTVIDPEGQPTAISCASGPLCVAVDSAGRVVSSRDPTSPEARWRRVDLDDHLTSVSCPTVSLCALTDSSGGLAVSTDPTGRARTWTFASLVTRPDLPLSYAPVVSCPSSSLCIAAIGTEVLFSTDPAGGAGTWHVTYRFPGVTPAGFGGLSCPSRTTCVATTMGGGFAYSSNPTGGQSAWGFGGVGSLPRTGPMGVACAGGSLCVVTSMSQLLTWVSPAAGGSGWSIGVPPAGYNSIEGLRCPSARLCVGYDNAGDVLATTRPSAGARAWSVARVDRAAISQMACPSARLCVALDRAGGVLTSHHPAGGRTTWRRSHIPGDATAAIGLACPTVSLCVALGGPAGDVVVSRDPGGGGRTWRLEQVDTSSLPCGGNHPSVPTSCAGVLDAISCPSRSLCVAVDSNGNALVSTNPAGGADTWTSEVIDPDSDPSEEYDPLQFVSCPSTALCVAADFVGNILSTSEPATTRDWNIAAVTSSYGFLGAFTCPAVGRCLGIAGDEAFVSGHPTAKASGWRAFSVGTTPLPSGYTTGVLACFSSRLCATSDGASVATSVHPVRGSNAWKPRHADSNGITALACASRTVCIAGDGLGDITVGKA